MARRQGKVHFYRQSEIVFATPFVFLSLFCHDTVINPHKTEKLRRGGGGVGDAAAKYHRVTIYRNLVPGSDMLQTPKMELIFVAKNKKYYYQLKKKLCFYNYLYQEPAVDVSCIFCEKLKSEENFRVHTALFWGKVQIDMRKLRFASIGQR